MTKQVDKFKKKHALLFKRLKEYSKLVDPNCLILFGSYAKGTETSRSDIDVLVISSRRDIPKISLTFKTKYNIAINPVVVNPSDFDDIKKDNPAFYKDMKEFSIVITGIELFFKKVYENEAAN